MRSSEIAGCLAAGAVMAVVLATAAVILICGDRSIAAERVREGATRTCPETNEPAPDGRRKGPSYAELGAYAQPRRTSDESDEGAALRALHTALTEGGDGATYVWQRPDRRLSGSVRPTASFMSAAGQVCRHLVVTLSADGRSRTVEGIACRQQDGSWAIHG